MDYFFWVLQEGARTVLVDTGFDPTVGRRRGRTCLCPPVEALARMGIERGSVDRIVLTHLHYDHIGNIDAFPDAEILVQERDIGFWIGSEGTLPEHAQHVEPAEIEAVERAERDGRVRRLRGDVELDPGVSAHLVGGHSPGQQVLVVESSEGPVVLASDALHYYEELERGRLFGIVVDAEEMRAGYELLARLTADPGARLVAGHDPAVLQRFPTAFGGLAARIV
jgi:glyoxylase-like metal-dependent hydrolase (beta-lactamase superfamily II)